MLYKALESRVLSNKNIEESEWLLHCKHIVERGGTIWNGCKNEKDLYQACARAEKLISNVLSKGFEPTNDPISVIKYKNEFVKFGNVQHRIMLAKILNKKLWVNVVFES